MNTMKIRLPQLMSLGNSIFIEGVHILSYCNISPTKDAWDDNEIHNEIQPTQQYTSTKDIAKVKTSIAMD